MFGNGDPIRDRGLPAAVVQSLTGIELLPIAANWMITGELSSAAVS